MTFDDVPTPAPAEPGTEFLHRLDDVIRDLESPRTSPVAQRALARWLADELAGDLGARVRDVADRFRHAVDGDAEDDAWTLCALRARVALERASERLHDVPLLARIGDLDLDLAPARSALMTIDASAYASAVGGVVVDRAAWWGWRARVDAALPEAVFDRALEALRLHTH